MDDCVHAKSHPTLCDPMDSEVAQTGWLCLTTQGKKTYKLLCRRKEEKTTKEESPLIPVHKNKA